MSRVFWIFVTLLIYSLIRITETLSQARKPTGAERVKEFKLNKKIILSSGYKRQNELRAQHNCQSLKIDDNLEEKAQKFAERLMTLKLKQLKHSGEAKKKGGESLFSISGKTYAKNSKNDFSQLGRVSVEAWYSEICLYNFDQPNVVWKASRFTQLVWNKTSKVGMGIAFDVKQNKYYVVANYNPPGNQPNKSEFAANVPCPSNLAFLDKICKPKSAAMKSSTCLPEVKKSSKTKEKAGRRSASIPINYKAKDEEEPKKGQGQPSKKVKIVTSKNGSQGKSSNDFIIVALLLIILLNSL